ncbi:MAG: YkvA family protein [Planctomycetota bacterium]
MFGFGRKERDLAEHAYRETAEHVGPAEVDEAGAGAAEKVERLGRAPGPLAAVWEDIKTMIRMLRDYAAGRHRDLPWSTVASVAAALLYFVSPIDVIPDLIPGLGFADDAAVIGMCLKAVRTDLEAYRRATAGPKVITVG